MLRRLRDRIRRKVERGVRAFYYGFVYGRTAVPQFLVSGAARWEAARPRGDTPQTAESWDEEYRRGRWTFLRTSSERPRYSVIVGLLAASPSPSVLDVGCGEGVLYQQFRPYGYSRYLGLDLSHEAIDRATACAGPDATFMQADAGTFQADGPFDAIVFNEMLYYLPEPLQAVQRYARAPSRREGASSCRCGWARPAPSASCGNCATALPFVDETLVGHLGHQWKLTVFGRPEP